MLPLESGLDLGPLLPEHWIEIVMGLLLFGIIYVVMARVVVPMFEKTYAERSSLIQGGIERAEHAEREAQATLADYRAQLAGAHEEAGRIREDAKAQGAAIVAEMRQQAQDESTRLLTNAKAQIEAERAQAVQQLKSEVGGLATTLAGRIVGESLDDEERARRTVERFIAELEQTPAEQV